MIFFGFSLLTVHPNETHVPKICFTVPLNSLDKLLASITLATFTTWSKVKFPSCLIFFVFFLSLSFSPNSLINYGAALGWIANVATLFWTFISTMTLIPFHLAVSLAKSSPTFLAFKPKGPSFGANDDAAPASPPTVLIFKIFNSDGSIFGGILVCCFL